MALQPSARRRGDLLRWRAQFSQVTPISELEPRQPSTCVGVVEAIRLVPGRSIEARISDGTGHLTAVWTGRSRVPGLELGSGLRVRGTVAGNGADLIVRNPDWALVVEPYG